MQRYNLPSLASNCKITTGVSLKAMRSNCNGSAIAGVTEDGYLYVFYTEDYEINENTVSPKNKLTASQKV